MIEFTEEESKLFKIIKEYALSTNPITTPRLAGGFVRDKLLGLKSHDIDITLDNISGFSFAKGISKTLENSLSVHKILANPDKSKHLETTVVNILGFSIDFVHLRARRMQTAEYPILSLELHKKMHLEEI